MDGQTTIDDVITQGDGHLHARTTDPWTSHASARRTEATEGNTHVLTKGTQKHRVLIRYGHAFPAPLTDHQVTEQAQLKSPCPWRRVRDLLEGGFVEEFDTIWDPRTKRDVRRCRITPHGAKALQALFRGERRYP